MYFRDIYKPIPPVYNLVLAMLWRHPENINLDQVKVVHYCAAVSVLIHPHTTFLLDGSHLPMASIISTCYLMEQITEGCSGRLTVNSHC